ncbi:MAG: FAD-dependent oxidoreductase [Planctomycetes bacterium]|nr:FAD-dependent oxidoreductase [Planctomycetota bacterium]
MSAPDYDVVVLGGGIHGTGVAQAAAAAGQRTLLLEQTALAAGTSSKSSKLIHGGLRYLESWDFGLVHESLRERAILLRVAPDLVRLVPFHIPVYKSTQRSALEIRAGLCLYALLGGMRHEAQFESLARERWDGLDGLRTNGLKAVFRYYDAQTDDALLTRAVMASAQELGAELALPATFLRAWKTSWGYVGRYELDGEEREFRTRTLVNAAGPWIERVRANVEPLPPGFAVDLVQGTHIELAGKLERGAYYAESPSDRRAVFTLPWKGRTLVGTTEKVHEGAPEACAPTPAEIEYLQEIFLTYFPGKDATVQNAWAGLRVLPAAGGSAFGRSRETILTVDDAQVPRYLAIYGGKLTGYRAAAEQVLRRLRPALPPRPALGRTDELPLRRPE